MANADLFLVEEFVQNSFKIFNEITDGYPHEYIFSRDKTRLYYKMLSGSPSICTFTQQRVQKVKNQLTGTKEAKEKVTISACAKVSWVPLKWVPL